MNNDMQNDLKQVEDLMRKFSEKHNIKHISMWIANGSCCAQCVEEGGFSYFNGEIMAQY